MGFETAAIVAASAISASATMNQGVATAKAQATQAEQQAQNSADNTLRSAGKLQSSFLQGGLELDGGPMSILSAAYAGGLENVSRITANGKAAVKNTLGAARSKAIEGLISGPMGASMASGAGDFASGFQTGFNNPGGGIDGWSSEPFSQTPGVAYTTSSGTLPWSA